MVGVCLFMAGCGNPSEKGSHDATEAAAPGDSVSGADSKGEHAHQHGAKEPSNVVLIDLGGGQYQAELIHDEAVHRLTVHLLNAQTQQPVEADGTKAMLQVFHDGEFVDYQLDSTAGDAPAVSNSEFTIVDETLSDTLSASDTLRGRLKISIGGKLLTGIVQGHIHGHPGHEHEEHDHGESGHDHNDDNHDHDSDDHAHKHDDADQGNNR
jgi:hypothetical protein